MIDIYIPLTKVIKLNNFTIYKIVELIQSHKLKIYCSLLDGHLARTSVHHSDEPIIEKDIFSVTNIRALTNKLVKLHSCHFPDVCRLILGEKDTIDISLVYFNKEACVFLKNFNYEEFTDILTKDQINKNWYNFPTFKSKKSCNALTSQYLLNDIAHIQETFSESIGIHRIFFDNDEINALKMVKPISKKTTHSPRTLIKNEVIEVANKYWNDQINLGKKPSRLIIMARRVISDFQNHPHVDKLPSEEQVKRWLQDIAPDGARLSGNLRKDED